MHSIRRFTLLTSPTLSPHISGPFRWQQAIQSPTIATHLVTTVAPHLNTEGRLFFSGKYSVQRIAFQRPRLSWTPTDAGSVKEGLVVAPAGVARSLPTEHGYTCGCQADETNADLVYCSYWMGRGACCLHVICSLTQAPSKALNTGTIIVDDSY